VQLARAPCSATHASKETASALVAPGHTWSDLPPCCRLRIACAGLPASTINEHLGMLLDAAQTAKSPAPLARNVMDLYDK
jgi:hypothetical protein